MINKYITNTCLIIFALIGPISLPAGGIQRSLINDLDIDNSNEIVLNINKFVYYFPENDSKKIGSLSVGTSASILRYWISSENDRWMRVEISKNIFINNPHQPLKGWIKI